MPYAIEREIEDIEAMIDIAGGTAFLYGHSSGAILALEAAMRLGDKVRKVVLYDPSYANNETELNEFRELGRIVCELIDSGRNEEAIILFLEGIGLPDEAISYMRSSSQWEALSSLAPTLAYDIVLASHIPPIEKARHVGIPIQIIIGEESPPAMHDVADQLSQAIHNASCIQLWGQNHMPDPEKLLPLLIDFLKE